MTDPLVSILTPSFEQGRWLADNLQSVARQTYRNVEHIVMDGGSTDGTLSLLENQRDPRVRWWSETDRGQSHALNKALARSRGEIIGWLNSDDAYFSRAVVEEAVRIFQHHPEVAVVYGHAALVNADGLVLHLIWAPPFSRRLLKLHDFILQPTAFIRRATVGDALADEALDFAMDYDLWLRLSIGRPFARMGRIAAIDRHHEARKSSRMVHVMERDRELLRQRYGIYAGPAADAVRKLWKVVTRLVGAGLIPVALREPLAFDGRFDSGGSLFRRQVGARRASMPQGERISPATGEGSPASVRSPDRDHVELVAVATDDGIEGPPAEDGEAQ